MDNRKIQALEGQSLFDIALQSTGSIEGVVGLAIKNGLSITGAIDLRDRIDQAEELDRRIRDYYDRRKIVPATGLILDENYQIFESTFDNTFE